VVFNKSAHRFTNTHARTHMHDNTIPARYTRCFINTGPVQLFNRSVEIDEILPKRDWNYAASRTATISYYIFNTTSIKSCKTVLYINQFHQRWNGIFFAMKNNIERLRI